MIDRYIYWKCGHCGEKNVSDKLNRWSMDTCSCLKSSVDAEIDYSRFLGNPIVITKEEYDRSLKQTKHGN